MSKPSRRPSISIHDYPEHLNPFNDNSSSVNSQIRKDNKSTDKETKHKFWSFGKGRKKRSHSFSIKSTWNGLFGKSKETPEAPERRSMITTVSTTYKRDGINSSQNGRPSKLLRDQQEFDEALGTLARRRKYTLDKDNGSRYNSSLTVNGDPARMYDGSPQETTTSIMGDLTPKPPARKFGQVSPKPRDKIPALDFEGKEHLSNGYLVGDDREPDRAPVPPRRTGLRASQRFTASDIEEEGLKSENVTPQDENENVPDDYIFKRFSQDAVRKSNLSINSISSTASGYTRKKRRAPQPPKPKSPAETPEECNVSLAESRILETPVADPLEISRVAGDIEELTKKTQIDDETSKSNQSEKNVETSKIEITVEKAENPKEDSSSDVSTELSSEKLKTEDSTNLQNESKTEIPENETIQVELRKKSEDTLEIIKEVIPPDDLKKKKSPAISRSNSFCVKDEINKIEKKLNELESRRKSEDSVNHSHSARLSIEENRRHFFQDLVNDSAGVTVEFKELPREQNDCHVIRLTDPPVPVQAPQDPVKVIELHIVEPIRQKPEILSDNPIPKPRRSSALSLERQPSIHDDINREESHPKGSSL